MTDVDCIEFNKTPSPPPPPPTTTTTTNSNNNSTCSSNKYGTTSNLTDSINDTNNNNNNSNVDLDVNKIVQLNTTTTTTKITNNNNNNSNNLVLDIDIDNEESIKSLSIDYYEQRQHFNKINLNQSASLIDQKSNDYSFRSSSNNSTAAAQGRLIIIDTNNQHQQLLNATTITINSTNNSDNNNNNNNANQNRQLYDDTSSIRTTNSSNLSLNSAHLIIQNRNYESIVIRGDGNITIFGIFNRFNDEFPSKLAAKIAPEEYKDTICKVNAILKKELSNSLKWLIFGSLCCCCTLGCSLLPVVYMNKKAKLSINKLLIIENERIYKKLGIKWRLTKQKCNSSSLFEYVILIDIIPALPLYQPD